MTTEAETTKPSKTPVRNADDGTIRIAALQFKGSIDLPVNGKFGGEQAISRLTTGERNDHRYEITFQPRVGLYVVKVHKATAQVAEYLIPREWAIASMELTPAKADS